LSPQQLKRALISSGFEIFRTLPEQIVLAERERENLILDSGVRLGIIESGLRVRVVLHVQRINFPTEEEDALFERVRKLAEPALANGFLEVSTNVSAVKDPVDPDRVLDTFYEVSIAREVASFEEAVPVLKFALSLERTIPAPL